MYVKPIIDKKIRKYLKVVKSIAYNAKNNFIISARWSVSITCNSFIKP